MELSPLNTEYAQPTVELSCIERMFTKWLRPETMVSDSPDLTSPRRHPSASASSLLSLLRVYSESASLTALSHSSHCPDQPVFAGGGTSELSIHRWLQFILPDDRDFFTEPRFLRSDPKLML